MFVILKKIVLFLFGKESGMYEHIESEHRTDIHAAVPCKRPHPVNNFAKDKVLDETFCVLVIGLYTVTDHRVHADTSQLVIVIVCYDTEG